MTSICKIKATHHSEKAFLHKKKAEAYLGAGDQTKSAHHSRIAHSHYKNATYYFKQAGKKADDEKQGNLFSSANFS